MGSYNFSGSFPGAWDVYVTGTFDDWEKTVKLDKKDQVWEKLVNLPPSDEKILYKFVVDGEWKHDPSAKTETDHEGNINNVLYPDDIKPVNTMAHNISSVAPDSTTAGLAGAQPLEKRDEDDRAPPGAFPETPAALNDKKDGIFVGGVGAVTGAVGLGAGAALASSGNKEEEKEQTFSVNPIPASAGTGNPVLLQAGEKVPEPSSINQNTIASTVRDDPSLKSTAQDSEQTLGVAPLPATAGIGNPVHLKPGEKVPESSTITANTVDSNVKLDKESYEKADSGVPQLPPVVTPEKERTAASSSLLGGLGPQTTNMIPESSMGMGKDTPAPLEGAAISSVGANSTTNQLAGQVPLEPRAVPSVVTESQKEAGVAPEASGNREAVANKKEVESELKAEVPPEHAGSGDNKGTLAGYVAGGLAAAGAATAGAAAYARQKTHETTGTDPVSVLPASVQKTVDENTKPGQHNITGATAPTVPNEVKESQKQANVNPEASANPEAVHEKSDVERELLNKVPASQEVGESAPSTTAATTAISQAPVNPDVVHEKADVEKELLSKVPESQATGQPAPTASAANTAIAPVAGSSTGLGTTTDASSKPSAATMAFARSVGDTTYAPEPNESTAGPSSTATDTKAAPSGAPQLADPTAGVAALSLDDKPKSGLNAPAGSQAQADTTKASALGADSSKPLDSRDVSPMSKSNPAAKTASQDAPEVTSGIDSGKAPVQSTPVGTPRKNQTQASSSTPTNKRNSVIDRLKGTPDSQKTTDTSGSPKKKGFFSKLKEKLKQ